LLAATFLGGLFYVRRLKDWIMRKPAKHQELGPDSSHHISEIGHK
jgi:hypothetical protein